MSRKYCVIGAGSFRILDSEDSRVVDASGVGAVVFLQESADRDATATMTAVAR
jgi:hypothetical protein